MTHPPKNNFFFWWGEAGPHKKVFFAPFGSFWLCLATFGYVWLRLTTLGYFWLLLGGSTTKKSDLLVFLVTLFEILWTLKDDCKKVITVFFNNFFLVNDEINCFGVVGVSDPIKIP